MIAMDCKYNEEQNRTSTGTDGFRGGGLTGYRGGLQVSGGLMTNSGISKLAME